jgi:hypothetical protein
MSDTLQKYIQEISEELKVDAFNIKSVQMRMASRKHFWVARLVNTKIELNRLKAKRKATKHTMVQQIIDNAPIKMSITGAQIAADNTPVMLKLTEDMEEKEIIVEYLEKVEKIMSSMHWEIKNIVDLQQMEMQ